MDSEPSFFHVMAVSCALALMVACSGAEKDPPPRDHVAPLLQQEAETMKREGESDVNPSLGVTVSWTIQSVDIREQPGNEAEPWAGTIRFLIESKTPELDGTATERFERSYDYVWELENERWAMR